MAWSIRRAVDADAPRIAEITVTGWRHAYRGIVPDGVLDGLDVAVLTARRREQIAAPAPTGVFVADDEHGVRGFVIVGAAYGPYRENDPPGTGMLATLYLDPAVIGTGAGAALHDVAVTHLADAGFARAVLWAFAGNVSALEFYARRGWRREIGPVQPDGWEAPCVRYERDLVVTRA